MANLITETMLQRKVDELNRLTNSPMEPYKFSEADGRHVAQIGNWHISGAYGGFQLHRMVNESGGVTTSPLNTGYVTRRQLYETVEAFIKGMEFKQ